MALKEAAEYIGVSRSTIRRLMERESLPYIVVGRIFRFDPRQLEQWCAARTIVSARPEANKKRNPS